MANEASTTETPVNTVTGSTRKGRKSKTPVLYFSKKDTKPFADVFDARKGEVVAGLTEEERIAEGSRQPFITPISFQKTEAEREAWRKVHTNARGPQGWIASDSKRKQSKHTLIVHLVNRKKDPKFKTTHTFKDVKEGEISQIFGMIIRLNPKDKKDSYARHIVKYHFKGVTIHCNG